jgi:hypothetical protein
MNMMSIILNKILFICFIIVSIESRRSLRDYIVSQNNFNILGINHFSVYDRLENDLLCRVESFGYALNPLSNLIIYPSQQRIASIRNFWSPFRNIFL